MNWTNTRIGQGYDVHALVEERKLVLDGVEIPHTRGLLDHSDAGALLRTIIDVLLGVVGLGDIDRHFPDTDPVFAGTDSRMLLREAVHRVHKAGYAIGNVGATVIAQKPKLAPHVPDMVINLVEDLGIAPERCNIKAKTNEKPGSEDKEEGIVTQAMMLICHTEGTDQD